MGYKYDENEKCYIVSASIRHPITKQPRSLRRRAASEREAKRLEKELHSVLIRRLERSKYPTCEEALESFLNECRKRGLSEKTIREYRVSLNVATARWSDQSVIEITTDQIREAVTQNPELRSMSYQQTVLKAIRGVFNHLLESGRVPRNPTPVIRYKPQDKIRRGLTEPQVRILLERAKEMEVPWYPHWALALYTGMRNGELFALTWDKVNFDDRTILVDSSWTRLTGFKSTKSGDDRILEIAPNLETVLRQLKIENANGQFVLPRLEKWEKGEQARELRMFLMGMGIPPIRFHDLRATWATLLLSKGVEPIKVMKMGGWKDLKTMMIYVRKAGVDIRGCTDCLDLHDPSKERGKVIQLHPSSDL